MTSRWCSVHGFDCTSVCHRFVQVSVYHRRQFASLCPYFLGHTITWRLNCGKCAQRLGSHVWIVFCSAVVISWSCPSVKLCVSASDLRGASNSPLSRSVALFWGRCNLRTTSLTRRTWNFGWLPHIYVRCNNLCRLGLPHVFPWLKKTEAHWQNTTRQRTFSGKTATRRITASPTSCKQQGH